MRELLAERDARLLFGSQWLAQATDGLAQVIFANELVLEPEGSPAEIAARVLAVAALTLVPYSFIAPFTGVLVDRWSRRAIMFWSNVVRGVVLGFVAVASSAWSGDAALYGSFLVLLGLGRLFLTTKGAVLPFVLHEHHLLQGNSLSGGGGMIAALMGGVAGVGVIALVSDPAAYAVGGVLYIVSGVMVGKLSSPMAHPRPERGDLMASFKAVVRDLGTGLVEIARRAQARVPLIAVFLTRIAAMIAAIAAILIIKERYPDAGDDFGRLSASALALGAAGAGALLAALLAPKLGRRFTEPRIMLIGFVIAGLGTAILGGIDSIPAVLGLTFVGGFGGFLAKVAVDAQVQRALPDEYRGRGFAVYDILYNLATVIAAALVILAEDGSLRAFLVGIGICMLLLSAVLASLVKRLPVLEGADAR
ncbi:MAG: MFS transporter [Actinomycetota bacterium]